MYALADLTAKKMDGKLASTYKNVNGTLSTTQDREYSAQRRQVS